VEIETQSTSFFYVNDMYVISLDGQFTHLVLDVRIQFSLSTILDCCVKVE
jgi:hypothetical protein